MERVNSREEELTACETCGAIMRLPPEDSGQVSHCLRCGSRLRRYRADSRSKTTAFALAALILYVPANIYPMLTMQSLGQETENTVWGGVMTLYRDGTWFVATVVFLASIVIPVLKLLGLFFLAGAGHRWPRESIRVYKTIRWLGPWAMLDVFLLAVAVALVKFGTFGAITPGPGVTAFTGVVVLTLLASSCYDPRTLWTRKSL
jgi:paraquat-inducible protein A